MNDALTDDARIVTALIGGDLSALGDAYDLYARHLFTYANAMVRDADLAADVVHDAMLIASQRIGQLRNPARFRPWLYAIVRSECLCQLRHAKKNVPLDNSFDFADSAVTSETATTETATSETFEERNLHALVAAAAGLSPKDREVLELAIRHDLDNAQVAAILGVRMNQASTLTSRARTQLERSLSVILVAQERGNECVSLDEILAQWDGEFSSLWRKRIGKHMNKCAKCSAIRDHKFRAATLLGILPLAAVPFWLRDLVVADAQVNFDLVALSHRIDPLDRSGFPQPRKQGHRHAPQGVWVGAAGAAIVVGTGVGLLMVGPAASQSPAPASWSMHPRRRRPQRWFHPRWSPSIPLRSKPLGISRSPKSPRSPTSLQRRFPGCPIQWTCCRCLRSGLPLSMPRQARRKHPKTPRPPPGIRSSPLINPHPPPPPRRHRSTRHQPQSRRRRLPRKADVPAQASEDALRIRPYTRLDAHDEGRRHR
ncbi:sigma-70 family RNA polymerase sigma factor [Rhodococcus sp. G-MC3]|uniref:RNA polymerase sigma factor n=1 Tax=Rhodococcus sp. G-MC3 TaxID=3046209 RepID=UPI0024BA3EEC|nr:sigma-70 family RNA polymerase sigma factor [Rhodococcus sp. G-MC3]MDJ0394320.1 sigma-70 family RNA polymerase sigma factor [Rhodococcus sp. G-MC3]